MIEWTTVKNIFQGIMDKLNNPPIRLLDEGDFLILAGSTIKKKNCRAQCNYKYNVICISNYKNKTELSVAHFIWHEIGHLLFPTKPHWWIECFAYKIQPKFDRSLRDKSSNPS